jgi:hypothetical protein
MSFAGFKNTVKSQQVMSQKRIKIKEAPASHQLFSWRVRSPIQDVFGDFHLVYKNDFRDCHALYVGDVSPFLQLAHRVACSSLMDRFLPPSIPREKQPDLSPPRQCDEVSAWVPRRSTDCACECTLHIHKQQTCAHRAMIWSFQVKTSSTYTPQDPTQFWISVESMGHR